MKIRLTTSSSSRWHPFCIHPIKHHKQSNERGDTEINQLSSRVYFSLWTRWTWELCTKKTYLVIKWRLHIKTSRPDVHHGSSIHFWTICLNFQQTQGRRSVYSPPWPRTNRDIGFLPRDRWPPNETSQSKFLSPFASSVPHPKPQFHVIICVSFRTLCKLMSSLKMRDAIDIFFLRLSLPSPWRSRLRLEGSWLRQGQGIEVRF
jgi:hypothetical protein